MLDRPENLRTCGATALIESTAVVMCFCILQVDVVCGDHLLDQYQALKDVQKSVGDEALQVSSTDFTKWRTRNPEWSVLLVSTSLQDGLLVLHFGLVLPSESWARAADVVNSSGDLLTFWTSWTRHCNDNCPGLSLVRRTDVHVLQALVKRWLTLSLPESPAGGWRR